MVRDSRSQREHGSLRRTRGVRSLKAGGGTVAKRVGDTLNSLNAEVTAALEFKHFLPPCGLIWWLLSSPTTSLKGRSDLAQPGCHMHPAHTAVPELPWLGRDGSKVSCKAPELLRVCWQGFGKGAYRGYLHPHALSEQAAN